MTELLRRFDGSEVWAKLTADQQRTIGATALEYIVSWKGRDVCLRDIGGEESQGDPRLRPFVACDPMIFDLFYEAVAAAVPEIINAERIPVPSLLGPVCRVCGCSECDADDDRGWAQPDLCSVCARISLQI